MSENKTRCSMCLGKKHVMSMGLIEKQCPECKGLGFLDHDAIYIEKKVEEKLEQLNKEATVETDSAPTKARGRPKRA